MSVVELDQCLHGYSEGHRLLANSRKLGAHSQRALRVLSDLSGVRLVKGFVDYLTGYILPEEGLYVFARTWYADECDRPGCVWTHSIFLPLNTLADVPDLTPFVGLFRRPNTENVIASYGQPIQCQLYADSGIPVSTSPFLGVLASCFYDQDAPVLIPAHNSESSLPVHLSLWRNAKLVIGEPIQFCSGAIQPREALTGQFDLQTVPQDALRDAVRSFPSFVVCEPARGEFAAPWAASLIEDRSSNERQAVDFIHRYGEITSRSDVGRYARVYLALHEKGKPIEYIVETAGKEFPDPSRAVRLKTAIAGGSEQRSLGAGIGEDEILLALLKSGTNSYDAVELKVPGRFAQLWWQDVEKAKAVLIAALDSYTLCSENILDSICDLVPATRVGALFPFDHSTTLRLLGRRPKLAANIAVWLADSVLVSAALDIVCSTADLSDIDLRGVIYSQLQSGATNLAARMIDAFGPRSANIAIEWLREDNSRNLPADWFYGFGNAKQLDQWLISELRKEPITSLSRLMDPASQLATMIPANEWLAAIDGNKRSAQVDFSLCIFVLCASLEKGEEGAKLFSSTFPIIYDGAERDVINERDWQLIAARFSDDGWWWDRCRRMRRGLVSSFAGRRWPIKEFVSSVPHADAFGEILSKWGWSTAEKDYLARVIRAIVERDVAAEKEIREVAQKYAYWFNVDGDD